MSPRSVPASIPTYGLTHLALTVRDLDRASRFYREVFGCVEVYRGETFVQVQVPGTHDVIVLDTGDPGTAGTSGGIVHFGFRLRHPGDIDAAAKAVTSAGGIVKTRGEFCPGEPYVFASDPDGYAVEIWYELPTPIDPAGR